MGIQIDQNMPSLLERLKIVCPNVDLVLHISVVVVIILVMVWPSLGGPKAKLLYGLGQDQMPFWTLLSMIVTVFRLSNTRIIPYKK